MRTGVRYRRLMLVVLLTLWAVVYTAAQEQFVVNAGETRSYFVEENAGSNYDWSVYSEPTFNAHAAGNQVDFPVGNTGYRVDIHWKIPGIYYILATETDRTGCTNTRSIAVTVVPNNRSVGFVTAAGNSCFNDGENSFSIPLLVLDNNGLPLTEDAFPLILTFKVNNEEYSELVEYSGKQLNVSYEWFDLEQQNNSFITIEITAAADVNGVPLQLEKRIFTQTISVSPVIEFSDDLPDTISLNTFQAFEVSDFFGYSYKWWYENSNDEVFTFSSESNITEEVFWETEGNFMLFVQATNASGCSSEIISKRFTVTEAEGFIPSLLALPDINVGYENTTLYGDVSINDFDFRENELNVVYSLEGDVIDGLTFFDNGTYEFTPPPGFTGKVSFSYRLCYTDLSSACSGASVEVRILPLETSGNIAPVAATDVVLTLPNQTVFSNLVVNDIDPDGFGIPLTISTVPMAGPQNGQVVIDNDGSFAYTPTVGFQGIDRFMYRVCDSGLPVACDSAWVYVIVSNFGEGVQKPVSASDDMFLHIEGGIYSLRENDYGLLGENLVYNVEPVISTSNGIVQIFPDGTFTYVPDHGFAGVDWFVYEVCNTETPPVCRQGTGFILVTPGNQWIELAGRDTTIGKCEAFKLEALDLGELFTYSWEPAELLDGANTPAPLFMPGETTMFRLTVSNEYGFTAYDSVLVTVSEIFAAAGEDMFMFNGESAVLDGSNSSGTGLQYLWTTSDGVIESGETTANPLVTKTGTYVLQVTDEFGCTDADSVNVGLLTYAPVAIDDFDTTEFRISVKINVLANDSDQDDDIEPSTLSVTVQPIHGSASVDFYTSSIVYEPAKNFSGNDYFEYQICDAAGNCANAMVYVLVNDFRLFIPEAFSPNNDGINDFFEIKGIEYYEGNSLEIFNRWGNRVYRADNYGIKTSPVFWDGKSNTGARLGNEDLPGGTYFYVLNLGNGENRIVGSVYLDR